MKIKEIERQSRRDFYAIYVCQFCGHEQRGSGYDDAFFHSTVIPKMKCDKCGKSVLENGKELEYDYRPLATKYPEGYQV